MTAPLETIIKDIISKLPEPRERRDGVYCAWTEAEISYRDRVVEILEGVDYDRLTAPPE